MTRVAKATAAAAFVFTLSTNGTFAQDPAVPQESAFVLNSLVFLVAGFLIMWMAAGVTMLEACFVRTKNAGAQRLKGFGFYAIASFASSSAATCSCIRATPGG